MESSSKISTTFTERFTEYKDDGSYVNSSKDHLIETESTVPKLGVMLVGLGGNNGTTFTAGLLAHKHGVTWESKKGEHKPNFYGSFSQCATVRTGIKRTGEGKIEDVYTAVKDILPQVNPVDFEVTGWDISQHNLYEAAKRA